MGMRTWTNAVDITTPVPNCLMIVDMIGLNAFMGSLMSSIGAKTPIELVTRTTKSVPTRNPTS